MSSKSIRKIAYKTPLGVVETSYHNLYTDLTKLREEVNRLGTLEDRLNVKVVLALPETLEDNVLYVVSDENVVDIKSILSRLTSHDVSITAINSDIEGLTSDVESLNGRIDETSQVIGLKTTELNTKLDTMQADIDEFKEKMNEQKTDFTANIVQLQDLTAKHTNDIKANADDIDALETALEEHKTDNSTEIARLDAKNAEQDQTLSELTGQGSGLSILDLKDAVANNTTKLTNHETRITTLETTVADNKSAYDSYVTSNDNRVKNLENLESAHNTAINTRADNLDTKIDTNRTEFLNTIERIDATTGDHETRITANTQAIQQLNDDLITTNADTIEKLETKIDTGLANETDARTKADNSLQDSVNEINLTDKDQNARIKALEEYTSNDFTEEISTLKNRATKLEAKDVDLESKVRAIQQFSSNHENRIANLEVNDRSQYGVKITALENTTKNQKNRLDGIDTLNTTQNNRLTAVENKNTEQDTTLGTHNDRITDLEEHRENLEEETRQIARDELDIKLQEFDNKLQELENNYHDEMMTKVEDMTSTQLTELSSDYNEFKDTVEGDFNTLKTNTNNSIQTFQGTLDTTLDLVQDTQTEIKNTQAEQKTYLENFADQTNDWLTRQDSENQSYYEKFIEADKYNKDLKEQLDDQRVQLYTSNPDYSEEVVDTVTEYETVTEEIPEEERDPEHPEITTREVLKEVQKEVTHTVDHVQANSSVALFETEDVESEDYTQYDYSALQAKIEALEATKDDYIDDIEAVNARISEIENSDDKINTLSDKIDATKTQVQGIGKLHAQTVERVTELEGYREHHEEAFNNYKTQQSKINNDQNDDLQSIHGYLDLNVQDMVDNYDKLQTQNQDDIVVLRKVVDTPASDETEETSHLELDSIEIIKVDDLVETKEELLKVRDLPVKGHIDTYLRGESKNVLKQGDHLGVYGNSGYFYTKESYYDFNLDIGENNDSKIIVSISDDYLKKFEIRKENVIVTTPAVLDSNGEVVTPETSENVLKYILYYVQTDEYINEEDSSTYTEDTEIKICEVDPSDYVEVVQEQSIISGVSYGVQRYYHKQIGSPDTYGYRMVTGMCVYLLDPRGNMELRPKNDPSLWQRDGNFIKTVWTINKSDWLYGNISNTSRGATCVDDYVLKSGEYVVKYVFNGNWDTNWYSRNDRYLSDMFIPTGTTYGTAGGNEWNQKSDLDVDIYVYNAPHLAGFAFNNFGGYNSVNDNKFSPNTREFYSIDGVTKMDKTVGRGRARYFEDVSTLM